MDRILACLSPSPSNPKILHAAAEMAGNDAELIALFVETPVFPRLSSADRERLQNNMLEAQRLGARIQTVSGDDVAFQIAEYARLSSIRKIVLGQSDFKIAVLPSQTTLPDRLAEYLPDAEIHVIPDHRRNFYLPPQREFISRRSVVFDLLLTILLLAVTTLIGVLLYRLELSNSSIMMVYLLGVLLIAVFTSSRMYSVGASVITLFLFNYFFVQPLYSLKVYEPGYPISLIVMFITAMITGTLASRLKQNARQSSITAFRTKIISDTDQMLAKAASREEILAICAQQSAKLLGKAVFLFETDGKTIGRCYVWPEDSAPSREEKETLIQSFSQTKETQWSYPVHIQEHIFALLYIADHDPPPEISAQSTLQSVLGECALALENEQNAREKEAAAVLAENERVRADLLRSISHDLRTPLTSISGNAGTLLENDTRFDTETRRRLYKDIYDDSLWLTELVENLLASTRIEGGAAQLRLSSELVEDILQEALAHIRPENGRSIRIEPMPEILMVRVDAKLIVQVVVNLVSNALKYTPADAAIRLSAVRQGSKAVISVSDEGPGISDEEKEHIFDMLYVGKNAVAAGRKSLGLGLALCRTIVNAHGGEICVSDNEPHGAVFTFTLPIEEVPTDG